MTTLHRSPIPALHHAYDDTIAGLDRTARIEANIAAIRLARQLAEEDRAASPEELAVLDRFTGWGGIAHVFEHRPDMPVPSLLRDELRGLLGEAEWHAAATATLTAFHTPRRLASAIAGGLQHLGYDGGRLLDPGAGTGAMIAALPEALRQRSQVTAVECNRTVAGIAQHLHPAVNVVADRLERSSLPDGLFDAAIGNLPFANVLAADRRYRNLSPLLHDYMALRTVDLLRWPGVIEDTRPSCEGRMEAVLAGLEHVLEALIEARGNEGRRLAEMLESRCTQILALVRTIAERLPEVRDQQLVKMRERIGRLGVEADEGRLEQEVALVAGRMDVAEELDRLVAHVAELRDNLVRNEPVGRRLDFLIQELNREANTLASKSVDTEVTRAAVELKVLIEQMREQVQNVE